MEVLSSAEDNSEVVLLDRAVLQISLHRCKQDLQLHRLLLVVLQISLCHCKQDLQPRRLRVMVLRHRACFALVVVPEDLSTVPEAEAPSAVLASPVVAAVQSSASRHQLWMQTVSPAAALDVESLWQTSPPRSLSFWRRVSQRAMRPRRGHQADVFSNLASPVYF